jgi:predicted Zn-dependent peptidase
MSRLSQKLADDQALAKAIGGDSIDTSMQRFADGATWCLNVDVEPNTVPLTVKALQSELERFGKEGITQTEFVEARRYLLGSIPVRSLGTLSATARTLLDGALRSEGEDPEATLLASVRNSTLDGVNRAIKHSLRPDGATLVVVGSAQSLRATRAQVAAGQQAAQAQAQQQQQATDTAASDKEVGDTANGAPAGAEPSDNVVR